MKVLEIYKNSICAPLLSDDWAVTGNASKVISKIKEVAKKNHVTITYWNGDKVTFTHVSMHTIKVPKKAQTSLEGFERWNIERIEHFAKDW